MHIVGEGAQSVAKLLGRRDVGGELAQDPEEPLLPEMAVFVATHRLSLFGQCRDKLLRDPRELHRDAVEDELMAGAVPDEDRALFLYMIQDTAVERPVKGLMKSPGEEGLFLFGVFLVQLGQSLLDTGDVLFVPFGFFDIAAGQGPIFDGDDRRLHRKRPEEGMDVLSDEARDDHLVLEAAVDTVGLVLEGLLQLLESADGQDPIPLHSDRFGAGIGGVHGVDLTGGIDLDLRQGFHPHRHLLEGDAFGFIFCAEERTTGQHPQGPLEEGSTFHLFSLFY